MALTVGTRLGHYDVTSLLGEGGMGQVCRRHAVGRQVALKIRLARFTREALGNSGWNSSTSFHLECSGGLRHGLLGSELPEPAGRMNESGGIHEET